MEQFFYHLVWIKRQDGVRDDQRDVSNLNGCYEILKVAGNWFILGFSQDDKITDVCLLLLDLRAEVPLKMRHQEHENDKSWKEVRNV